MWQWSPETCRGKYTREQRLTCRNSNSFVAARVVAWKVLVSFRDGPVLRFLYPVRFQTPTSKPAVVPLTCNNSKERIKKTKFAETLNHHSQLEDSMIMKNQAQTSVDQNPSGTHQSSS